MKYILIILLFTSLSLFAQNNIEVSYLIQYNTEMPNQRIGNLQIDLKQNKSVFLASKGSLESGATQKDDIIRVIQKGVENYVIMSKSKDSIYTRESINNGTYIVCETIPVFKWEFDDNETKKIGNYDCRKATTTFRGRNYIAWYSLEFPIPYGPWKFNGLPGLILEVYDETDRYHWTVRKIKNINNEIEMPNDQSNYAKIDLKKYAELRYGDPFASDNARLPRGAYTVTTFKANRNAMEIKFEWEE